jgi:hypothetical protein
MWLICLLPHLNQQFSFWKIALAKLAVKAGFTKRNLRFLPEKALSGYPDGQNWLALTVDFTALFPK